MQSEISKSEREGEGERMREFYREKTHREKKIYRKIVEREIV